MPTLHLLPGESRGSSADIVLSPLALEKLLRTLSRARRDGYATADFQQRDKAPYGLYVSVIDQPVTHLDWRHQPLAYMRHQTRHALLSGHNQPYDADLLSAHLYAARKAKGHSQQEAARAIGVSLGFVSNVEHCKFAPRPENFVKLCRYIGTSREEYNLT